MLIGLRDKSISGRQKNRKSAWSPGIFLPSCLPESLLPGVVSRNPISIDDFSYNIVKDPIHIHDLNATLLHQLGIEHTAFTHRHQGRDYRLTDIHGNVVKDMLA